MNREEYRQLCRHYSPYSGQCYKKSIITGVANNVHINMSCDGKCARMSNYDKKNTVVIERYEEADKICKCIEIEFDNFKRRVGSDETRNRQQPTG